LSARGAEHSREAIIDADPDHPTQLSFSSVWIQPRLRAVLIVTIAVAVSDRPAAMPEGVDDINIILFGKPTFAAAMGAVGQLLFAWAGTPAM
jgi:hypothetical protein